MLNERLLLRGIPLRHTAIQYGVLGPQTGLMKIANAGMQGPMLVKNGECQLLQSAGIPPGLFSEVSYELQTITLQPGDSLLFYTDGLTEARNSGAEEFDVQRLMQVCTRHADRPGVEFRTTLFDAVQTFTGDSPQWDDMTAAILHFTSLAGPAHETAPFSPNPDRLV